MRSRTKAQASGQSTYIYSTLDPQGNRTTVTKKVSDPLPAPAGMKPLPASMFQQGLQPPPGGSQQASGGFGPPPTSQAAPTGQKTQGMTPPPQPAKTAKAGMAPPPGGKQTPPKGMTHTQGQTWNNATTQRETIRRNAIFALSRSQNAADAQYQKTQDYAEWQRQYGRAQSDYDTAIAGADDDFNTALASVGLKPPSGSAAVKSIGGTPGNQQPIEIQAPDGYTYTFPDQKSADAFKQAAGIQ